jgi:hypothetical protein
VGILPWADISEDRYYKNSLFISPLLINALWNLIKLNLILSTTVRGMMYYHKALQLQTQLESSAPEGWKRTRVTFCISINAFCLSSFEQKSDCISQDKARNFSVGDTYLCCILLMFTFSKNCRYGSKLEVYIHSGVWDVGTKTTEAAETGYSWSIKNVWITLYLSLYFIEDSSFWTIYDVLLMQ